MSVGGQALTHLVLQKCSCTNNAMEFAYYQTTDIVLFAGAEILHHGVTSEVLKKLLEHAQDEAIFDTAVVQLCEIGGRSRLQHRNCCYQCEKTYHSLKKLSRLWANGVCVSGSDAGKAWLTVTLRFPAPVGATPCNSTDMTPGSINTT